MSVVRRVRLYLLVASTVFLGSCALCMLIRPDLFDHPDYGISYFGSRAATVVPYTVGLLTLAYCMWRISEILHPLSAVRPLRLGFLVGGACIAGMALTPMELHPVVWWTHMAIGLVLMISQIYVIGWVLLRKDITWIDNLLGIGFVGGGIALILSGTWPGLMTICAVSQLIVFTCSVLLMGRAALRAVHKKRSSGEG